MNSFTTFLKSSKTLDIFNPPAVEPAHPPTNIINNNIVLENTGHLSKSAVENPVVVIIEDTVKKISLIIVEKSSYIECMLKAIRTIAPKLLVNNILTPHFYTLA